MAKSNIVSTYRSTDGELDDSPKARVVEELKELEAKLKSLYSFLDSDKAKDLVSERMYDLLEKQSIVMAQYVSILKTRLDIWDLQD